MGWHQLAALLCVAVWVLPSHYVYATMLGPHASNETLVGRYMTISWSRVPTALITFQDAAGNPVNGAYETFTWLSLNEVDNSTGTAVQGGTPVILNSLDILDPSLVWTEVVAYQKGPTGATVYKNVNFTATFQNGVEISLCHFYYPATFRLDYPYLNYTRDLPPDTFKISITIKNWKAQNMSNIFLLRLDDNAYPYYRNVFVTGNQYLISATAEIADLGIFQTLNIINAALVDQVPVPLFWTYEHLNLTLIPELTATGDRLFFYFPQPNDTLFYDPDISVLVADRSTGTGDGGDDNETILVAVLVPVLAGGAFLALLVAVAVGASMTFFRLWRRKRIQTRIKDLNDGSTGEDTPA